MRWLSIAPVFVGAEAVAKEQSSLNSSGILCPAKAAP